MDVLTLKLVIQQNVFTAFETSKNLNYVSCNYVHLFPPAIISAAEKISFSKRNKPLKYPLHYEILCTYLEAKPDIYIDSTEKVKGFLI